jgi:hypothetical protein
VPILKRNTHGAAIPLPLLLPIEIAPSKMGTFKKGDRSFIKTIQKSGLISLESLSQYHGRSG